MYIPWPQRPFLMINRDKIPAQFGGQTIIRFEDVSFEWGANKPILDEVNFTIRQGTKITLMGQNGAGKTTIFGLILGDHKPESGEVHVANNASIATARQVIPRPDLELTVREFFAKCFKEKVYDLDPKIDEILEVVNLHVPQPKKKQATATSSQSNTPPPLGERVSPFVPLDKLVAVGRFLSPAVAADVSPDNGTVFESKSLNSSDLKDRLIKTFSGGQQARLLLASALIQDPDILLLDEPTNNLDKAGIEHLTNFLINYKKTCLVISHDAEFLNAFTHGVLYLDLHTRKVEQYVGDYNDVVEQITARI
ncbi:MAG: ATP-binding cassette domain-containing protein, partial [Candidatus Paceibacterota bacterium]